MVEVVNTSADMNVAQLVGTQSGQSVVPIYNWNMCLGAHFRSVPHLKNYHHFTFSSSQPGVVVMKEFSDSQQVLFTMLDDDNWIPAVDEQPPVIQPIGLSPTRQWYLFRQIREYCREGTQDLTCPKPLTPLPGTRDDPSCLTEPPKSTF